MNTESASIINAITNGQEHHPWKTIMAGVYKIAEYDASHRKLSSFKAQSAGMKWLLAELVFDLYYLPITVVPAHKFSRANALEAVEELVESTKNGLKEKTNVVS